MCGIISKAETARIWECEKGSPALDFLNNETFAVWIPHAAVTEGTESECGDKWLLGLGRHGLVST